MDKVKPADLTIMTRQLATMVSSGMTILRALYVLEAQTESKPLAEVLVKVRKDVEAGLPLSDALERHPKVFSPLFVAMTRAGETGGMLEVLAAAHRRPARGRGLAAPPGQERDGVPGRRPELRAVVLSAWWPSSSRCSSASSSSSAATCRRHQDHRRAVQVLTTRWYLLIAIGVGVVFGFRKWKAVEAGRAQWDAFRLRIPFKIGDIVQKVALARWSRTLSALITAGVPLLQALDITAKTAGNRVVENAMADVIESVKRGGTIADPLKAAPVFPGMVTHMVGVGEETGALDQMLTKIADFYEDQVNAAVKSLTSILEPVDARRRRRHRRVHRDLDVHALFQVCDSIK